MALQFGKVSVAPQDPTRAWEKLQVVLSVEDVDEDEDETPQQQSPGTLRVVCISDTHSRHAAMQIPDGDVLIHAGDITSVGKVEELRSFEEWMGTLPHATKIVIGGNHDITLDEPFYKRAWNRFHGVHRQDAAEARAIMTQSRNFVFLEDSAVDVHGYKVYGSPWQPEFHDWAFNLQRGPACAEVWAKIPNDTDILVTHGPPLGHGDLCRGGHRAGCADLLHCLTYRVKPLLHIFGHIHEGYGITTNGTTKFVNASSCNLAYRPKQPPIVVDLPRKDCH